MQVQTVQREYKPDTWLDKVDLAEADSSRTLVKRTRRRRREVEDVIGHDGRAGLPGGARGEGRGDAHGKAVPTTLERRQFEHR